jgi:hypothetical protein
MGTVSIGALDDGHANGQNFNESTILCADRNEAIARVESLVESILAPFAAATGR